MDAAANTSAAQAATDISGTPGAGGPADAADGRADGSDRSGRGDGAGRAEGAGRADGVGRLTASVLAAAGLVWLAASLITAHASVVGNAEVPAVALGAAAFALPTLVAAALVAGAASALAAGEYTRRGGGAGSAVWRVVAGLGTAAVLGGACAGLVVYGYGTFAQVTTLAGTVAGAAVLGAVVAVLVPSPVLASGLFATIGVLLLGLVAGLAQPNLVGLFGGGTTLDSQVTASYTLAYVVGVLGGILAGAVAFGILRRHPARVWPWYLLAGALPGLLLLTAELVARLGGASLIEIVRNLSDGDRYAIDLGAFSRLRNAMVVTFVGGLTALVAVGRTLRRPH